MQFQRQSEIFTRICEKMDEYFVAISVDGDVRKKEWFHSLHDAKKWADDYDGFLEYTVTIYKNAEVNPILKYDRKSLF